MGEVSEIEFGFAKVWNFNSKKDKYVKNLEIKDKLEKIFSMYVSGNSIDKYAIGGIGIVSIGKIDFRHFSPDEMEIVKNIQNILFLCFLSKNNIHPFNPNMGHRMATSDNFDIVIHKINLEDDYVAERTGYIVPFLIGGYKFDELSIQKPSYVPSPNFSLDMNLFSGLLELKNKRPLIFKRIMTATEIMRESYYNSPHLSENARILLQMSSFEILLEIPEGREKRKFFKEKIGKICNLPNEKTYVNYYQKGKKENLTFKQLWAEKFYLLRNNIIHGNSLSEKDFIFKKKQRHIEIASLFFILSCKKQLERSLKNFPCDYEIVWKKWRDRTFNQDREEFVYELYVRRLYAKIFKPKNDN